MVDPQTTTWTVLPAGVDADGRLRLVVHVAPRLPVSGVLSDYPEWTDSPATAAAGGYALVVGSHQPLALELAATPRSDLWAAMFPPATTVAAHTFPAITLGKILSYPVAHISDFLARTWSGSPPRRSKRRPRTVPCCRTSARSGSRTSPITRSVAPRAWPG